MLEACDQMIALDEENGLYYNSWEIVWLSVRDQIGAGGDFEVCEQWMEVDKNE